MLAATACVSVAGRRGRLPVLASLLEPRIFLLDHEGARGARRHDRVAAVDPAFHRRHERPAGLVRALDVPHVEERHSAAQRIRDRHLDPVPLEHRDRGLPDLRPVPLDGAGREKHDLRDGLPRLHGGFAGLEPRRERPPHEMRQVFLGRDAEGLLQRPARERQRVHEVRDRRDRPREAAEGVGAREQTLAKGQARLLHPDVSRLQDEVRDVHRPAVRRDVRAMRDAELALVAEVHEVVEDLLRQLLRLAVHLRDVQPLEEHVEGRAQREAAPAAVADVGDARQLGRERWSVDDLDGGSDGAHHVRMRDSLKGDGRLTRGDPPLLPSKQISSLLLLSRSRSSSGAS